MPPTVIVGGTGQPPVIVDMAAVEEATRYDYSARRLMMPGAEEAYRSRLMLRQPNVALSSQGSRARATTPRTTTLVQGRKHAPAPPLLSTSGHAVGGGRSDGEPDFAMVDDLLDSLAGDEPRHADVPDPSDTSDADFAAMFDTSPEVAEEPQEEIVAAPRMDVIEEPLMDQTAAQMTEAAAPEPLMPGPAALEYETASDEPAATPEPIFETVTAIPEEIPAQPAQRPESAPAAEPAAKAPTQMASLPAATESVDVLRQIMVEFDPDSTALSGDMISLLDNLGARLVKEKTRVKLQAFAGKPGDAAGASRRLSLKRALAVRSLLIGRGVRSTRIDVRANGIADDDKPSERVDVTVTQ